jgi:MFS family permease
MGAEFCFTTGNLLLKEAVPSHLIGAALGVGNTAVGVGAAIGPILGSSLFAFSLSLHKGSFGGASGFMSSVGSTCAQGKLCFIVLELLVVANLLCSTTFPAWPWGQEQKQEQAHPKANQVAAEPSETMSETMPLCGVEGGGGGD